MSILLWTLGFTSGFLTMPAYALCKVSGDCSRREEDSGLV